MDHCKIKISGNFQKFCPEIFFIDIISLFIYKYFKVYCYIDNYNNI